MNSILGGNYGGWFTTGITTTSGTITVGNMMQYCGPTGATVVEEKPAKPESVLEWLDRRVDEMRVRL